LVTSLELAVGAFGDDRNGAWSGRVDVFLADGFGLVPSTDSRPADPEWTKKIP